MPNRAAFNDAFAAGERHYRAGEYEAAAAVFERLSHGVTDDAAPLRMLGLCHLRLGDSAAAIRLLARANNLAPNDPYVQLHYGVALNAVGRHAEAAERFRACRVLLPDDPAPFLNLASALLALDRPEPALDAARRARRRAPAMPEAHYTLGLALLACKRFIEAAEAFDTTLRLAPDFADAWVNLGVARYNADNIEGAKAAMRQALAVAPGHRAATANLSVFLRLTGEGDASEALLRDLLARDSDAIEARLNLAAGLLQEERPPEAIAVLDARPKPTQPRLAQHWTLQRSLALLQLGRADEAETLITGLAEVTSDLRPLMLWRRLLLSLAKGDVEGACALAGEMTAALNVNSAILPEHRIMAHFDLARFWSMQREPDRGFPHWIEAHRLLARLQPFSRDAASAFFEALIARFGHSRLDDGARAANRDAAPVFIVGMPRSGTTLTEQIIAAHPQAYGAGERHALGDLFDGLAGDRGPTGVRRVAALDAAALDRAAAPYLAELHSLAPGAARIIDKMPGNFNYLGLVALMLPAARIIYCSRDPRDIGLSIFTFRFYGYHPYAHDLGDLGWYIAWHQRLMEHWCSVLPNPMLTVKLTDWIDDFPGTLRRVLAFLELPYDAACERFYEQDTRVRTVSRTQVRQPINARGIGRWRAYRKHLQPMLAALAEAGALPREPDSSHS